MKSILFRSVGVSILLLSLSLFAIADDGDMGTGSRTDPANGGGSAPISEITEINVDQTLKFNSTDSGSDSDLTQWFVKFFSELLN